jgi:basic membrane protein A
MKLSRLLRCTLTLTYREPNLSENLHRVLQLRADDISQDPPMTYSRRSTLQLIGAGATLGIAGCLTDSDDASESGPTGDDSPGGATGSDDVVEAAFVYHDSVGDFGWQWAHDQGRRAIVEEYEWVETTIFDTISAEGSQPRFEQIAERGFDVIYGTSFDYMDPMYVAAADYPAVVFENCSGYRQRDNMGRYFGRMYQARYLTGVAAGLLTEADELGYVAAFPISEVIRGINAFALGAASVNENVTVRVRYTDTWNDAEIESNKAELLLDAGVDVMAQHQNYPAAAETAAAAGIWATGYNSSMGDLVGDRYVTSPIWNWEVFYRQSVEAIRDGTWESDFYWEGLDVGVVGLSDWGPEVPESVRETVATKRTEIAAGNRDVWAGSPFETYDDEELYREVDSYVDSVAGETPG